MSETEQTAEADQRVRYLGRRLMVAAILFLPLCDVSIIFSLFPVVRFPYWQWLLVVLAAPVVTWAAWPFYSAAIRGARHRTCTMDTLVSIGIVAATGWSLYCMFWQDTSRAAHRILFCHYPSGGWQHLPRRRRWRHHVPACRPLFRGLVQAPDRERAALACRRRREGRRRSRRPRIRAPPPDQRAIGGQPIRRASRRRPSPPTARLSLDTQRSIAAR